MSIKVETVQDRIRRDIIGKIESGELNPGDSMLSTKEMASYYKVSLVTAHKVLKRLSSEKYLIRKHGCRTRVSKNASNLESAAPKQPSLNITFIYCQMQFSFEENSPILKIYSSIKSRLNGINGKISLLVFDKSDPPDRIQSEIDASSPDIIVTSYPSRPLTSFLKSRNSIPTIILSNGYLNLKADRVYCDYYLAGWEACEYLIRKSAPIIAEIDMLKFNGASEEYRTGFYNYFRCHDLGTDNVKRLVYTGPDSLNEQLLEIKPTAIVVQPETVALELAVAINRLGLKVPEDIEIVGCGYKSFQIANSGIRFAKFNEDDVAENIIEQIQYRMKHKNAVNRRIVVEADKS